MYFARPGGPGVEVVFFGPRMRSGVFDYGCLRFRVVGEKSYKIV